MQKSCNLFVWDGLLPFSHGYESVLAFIDAKVCQAIGTEKDWLQFDAGLDESLAKNLENDVQTLGLETYLDTVEFTSPQGQSEIRYVLMVEVPPPTCDKILSFALHAKQLTQPPLTLPEGTPFFKCTPHSTPPLAPTIPTEIQKKFWSDFAHAVAEAEEQALLKAGIVFGDFIKASTALSFFRFQRETCGLEQSTGSFHVVFWLGDDESLSKYYTCNRILSPIQIPGSELSVTKA